ncbi:hypothetical protein evm_003276 [Chilo suppressalis]|nr:hypothetical protein evm_003276 [Chilo suppressalis]
MVCQLACLCFSIVLCCRNTFDLVIYSVKPDLSICRQTKVFPYLLELLLVLCKKDVIGNVRALQDTIFILWNYGVCSSYLEKHRLIKRASNFVVVFVMSV